MNIFLKEFILVIYFNIFAHGIANR